MGTLTVAVLTAVVYLICCKKLGAAMIRQSRAQTLWRIGNPLPYSFTVLTALPLWFFLGYLLSPTYAEFRAGCANDVELEVVRPYPTRTVYSPLCGAVRQAVFDREYERGVCPQDLQRKDATLFRRVEPTPGDCTGPRDDACFSIEPTALPPFAYKTVFSNTKRYNHALFADSMLRVQTDFVDQQGELMAYRRTYTHYPHGNLSRLMRQNSRCRDTEPPAELMYKLYPPEPPALPR